jgi:hypothetical protein
MLVKRVNVPWFNLLMAEFSHPRPRSSAARIIKSTGTCEGPLDRTPASASRRDVEKADGFRPLRDFAKSDIIAAERPGQAESQDFAERNLLMTGRAT